MLVEALLCFTAGGVTAYRGVGLEPQPTEPAQPVASAEAVSLVGDTLLITAHAQRAAIELSHVVASNNSGGVGGGGGSSSSASDRTVQSNLAERMTSVCASGDGEFVCAGSVSGKLWLWHMRSGALLRVLPAHFRDVAAVRFSADGSLVLSGGGDACLHVHSVPAMLMSSHTTPLMSYQDHTLAITGVAASAVDSGLLVSGSLDHTVRVYVLGRGLVGTVVCTSPVHAVVLARDETRAFAGCGSGVLYSIPLNGLLASAEPAIVRTGLTGALTSLAESHDGQRVFVGDGGPAFQVWDARTLSLLHVVTVSAPVLALVPSLRADGASAGTSRHLAPVLLRKHVSTPDELADASVPVMLVPAPEQRSRASARSGAAASVPAAAAAYAQHAAHDASVAASAPGSGADSERTALRARMRELEDERDRWRKAACQLAAAAAASAGDASH